MLHANMTPMIENPIHALTNVGFPRWLLFIWLLRAGVFAPASLLICTVQIAQGTPNPLAEVGILAALATIVQIVAVASRRFDFAFFIELGVVLATGYGAANSIQIGPGVSVDFGAQLSFLMSLFFAFNLRSAQVSERGETEGPPGL